MQVLNNPPSFARLIYDSGIRWNWYYVIIGSVMAIFRLHHDDKSCWQLLDLFSKENKKHLPTCCVTYEDSGEIATEFADFDQCRIWTRLEQEFRPVDFEWLANCLQQDIPVERLDTKYHPFDYFGVEFYLEPTRASV